MRYRKGSVVINEAQDLPLLLLVRIRVTSNTNSCCFWPATTDQRRL